MIVFQFIKWWFERLEPYECTIGGALIGATIYFSCMLIFDAVLVLKIGIGIAITLLVSILVVALIYKIRSNFALFKKEKANEAIKIINRLKGGQ